MFQASRYTGGQRRGGPLARAVGWPFPGHDNDPARNPGSGRPRSPSATIGTLLEQTHRSPHPQSGIAVPGRRPGRGAPSHLLILCSCFSLSCILLNPGMSEVVGFFVTSGLSSSPLPPSQPGAARPAPARTTTPKSQVHNDRMVIILPGRKRRNGETGEGCQITAQGGRLRPFRSLMMPGPVPIRRGEGPDSAE